LTPLAYQEDITAVAAGLDGFESDCAITVALKITDDSCKMDAQQRALFMALYDALQQPESELFDADIHALIESGPDQRAEGDGDGAHRQTRDETLQSGGQRTPQNTTKRS